MWDGLESPSVNILFMTKLLSLDPLSWDMDCLLTLWPLLSIVPLVTVTVCLVFWSLSLSKEISCTTAYIYSQKDHWSTFAPSELGSPCIFFFCSLSLSLFLSLQLIIWSVETRRIHPPAWASKTPLRRHPVPSPPPAGALCLHEQCKPCVKSFIGSLHKPGNISLFLSFTFLLSTQTTRSGSIKGPQPVMP